MAAPSSGQDSGAGLTLNLSSNNPFRNRAVSPAPASPFDDPPARPLSRNPFLDGPPPPVRSPGTMSTQSDPKSLTAEDIFDSLTLDDKKKSTSGPRSGDSSSDAKRPENIRPPPGSRHRPTPSQEEALRARKPQPGGPRPGGPNNNPSPQRRPQPRSRPRRNSESSVMEINSLTEEEKQMIEDRRRERRRAEAARAAREGKPKEGGEGRSERPEGKPRERTEGRDRERDGKERRERKPGDKNRPSRRMDIIDQLDATSIYGTGLFHHDGPFDALNPHRNRNGRRAAPMQAFPKDSMNMSLGGSGPLNKAPDHATFMGNHDQEAFREWTTGKKARAPDEWMGASSKEAPIFDSTSRGDMIHGDASVGLGTSTFLEGTPAARTAVVQQQQEEVVNTMQRKKSLAQRMRPTFKGSSREYGRPERRIPSMRSPDGPQSAGAGGNGGSGEANPFFNEFSKGEESISVKRDGALSPTSPPARRGSETAAPLERRVTTDALPEVPPPTTSNTKPSGILGRMKSLKGGRRQRERPEGAPAQPQVVVQSPREEEAQYPGTAV